MRSAGASPGVGRGWGGGGGRGGPSSPGGRGGWAPPPSPPPSRARARGFAPPPPRPTRGGGGWPGGGGAGGPLFVVSTAAWCITCLVNERIALEPPTTRHAFEQAGVVKLKGDWTNRDAEITSLLRELGRAGVPLYLFWAPGAERPKILPQVLTESLILSELSSIHQTKR